MHEFYGLPGINYKSLAKMGTVPVADLQTGEKIPIGKVKCI